MFDIIVGYVFLGIAVVTFFIGLGTAVFREESDNVGYCALGLFPLLVSFFFLTSCSFDSAGKPTISSWTRVYEQQKNEHDEKMAKIELERTKTLSGMPIEKK